RLSSLPDLPKNAGDVDDTAPSLLQHRANHSLDQHERSGEIGVDYFVPLRALHAYHQLITGNAGVVHENVNLTELSDHCLDSCLNLFFVAHVHFEHSRVSALAVDLAGELLQLLLVAGAERDLGPRLRKHQRTCTPNPLRRSGYQRDPAFHSCHETSCM